MSDKRIDCFVAGVQKAGTTSLFGLLENHPQLAAPSRKELHFFDDERRDWAAPDYGELARFYTGSGDGMRFEVTPAYSFWPQSMDRLQRYNPDARIILLFRDPFERAWSHWCMQYARGKETLSFASAIRTERHRLEGLPPDAVERRYFSYVGRGRYGSQLRRILALFPRDQLLLLTAEAFARDQSGILASISDFLGIDGFPPMPPAWEHRRPAIPYPCEPRDEDRALIYDLLREEMDELAEHTRSHIRYPMHDPFRPGSDQAQEKPPPIR